MKTKLKDQINMIRSGNFTEISDIVSRVDDLLELAHFATCEWYGDGDSCEDFKEDDPCAVCKLRLKLGMDD